jgi:mannose-6-phosphate isomerase-like protein (cupin superfamily)
MRWIIGRKLRVAGVLAIAGAAMFLGGCGQSERKGMENAVKINIKEGKHYTVPTHSCDLLIPREKTNTLETYHVIVDQGRFTHKHIHKDMEQLYYVTAGQGKVVLSSSTGEEKAYLLKPGDLFYIPQNTWHQVFCLSQESPLTYLCVDTFPRGIPANEPTWDSHIEAVLKSWPQSDKK